MGKILIWLFVFAFLGALGWVGWKWYSAQNDISVDAYSLVPADAIYCIVTEDPIATWKDIAGSEAWAHLQKNEYFSQLTASANSLDSLIRDNNLLFDLIGSRALMVSAHITSAKEHDFLFLVDLKEASGIKFLNEYLTTFSAAGLLFSKEKYNDVELIRLYDPDDKTNLYLSLPGTYLLASYSKKIITAALDSRNNDPAIIQASFIQAGENLNDNGIFKLHVNYTMLPQFMNCFSSGTNEYVNRLSQTLKSTGLNVTLDDELIKATGFTYINDTIESYLNTLAISGQSATEVMEIAPQRTAFCLALGFSSFREFFDNFQKNIQQDVTEYNTYRENLKQVEDYLKIDLQENFINWIGDEVAIIELQSSGKGLDNEMAVVLKADNIEKAREDLAYIEKMVRKKTPVKFKAVDHKGFAINYLSMKGLFKILLGKFFARYDKPYYTIINNFVIFSNHPQTLQSIIDDYLDKSTLVKSEEFRRFRKEFEDESSVFVYLNTPVLFNTMKKLADNPTRVSMETNKEYIVCFRQIGFQLAPDQNGFKTTLAEQFEAPPPPPEPVISAADTTAIDSLEKTEVEIADESETDPMELPYIYVQNLNASAYSGYFPDSTVQFTVELKNGFKDGDFVEYYSNGEVKMRGTFKDDKRDGTWRLYDENGKLMLRRNYQDGEIIKEKVKD